MKKCGTKRVIKTIAAILLCLLAAGQWHVSAESSWYTYRGDSALRGRATANVPDAPVRLWSCRTDSEVEHTPVTDGSNLFFSAVRGTVYSLAMTGATNWVSRPQSILVTTQLLVSTPMTVVDGLLLAGTEEGTLIAMESKTGKTKWEYDLYPAASETGEIRRAGVSSAPVISGKRVMVVSRPDGRIHSVDLASGKGIWVGEETERSEGTLAVEGDHAVLGNCAGALFVFSANDGKLIHKVPLGSGNHIAGGAVIDGLKAFTGSNEGMPYCVNLQTGAVQWEGADAGDALNKLPALSDDRVVFVSDGGKVLCLGRSDGRVLWNVQLNGELMDPVIAGDRVIVAAGGTLHFLSLKDGAQKRALPVSDSITAPCVTDRIIAVGSADGRVIVLGNKQ